VTAVTDSAGRVRQKQRDKEAAMTIEAERAEIVGLINNIPTRKVRMRLRNELDDLIASHAAAVNANGGTAAIDAQIAQIRKIAEIASQASFWSVGSMILTGVVIVIYFGSIVGYMWGLGPSRYATPEGIRPILVFTLIVAMLGFGGLLIATALFSAEEEQQMQNRFRHAREVFLVFAGIFGTIIGFYFGTESTGTAADSPVLAAPVVGREGLVTVSISNGRAPYSGTIRLPGGGTLSLAPTASRDQLAISLNPAHDCPAGATVKVVDGENRAVERTVEQTAAQLLAAGWAGCAAQAAGEGENAATPANGSGDANNMTANAVTP
jgi:hypothetical protein